MLHDPVGWQRWGTTEGKAVKFAPGRARISGERTYFWREDISISDLWLHCRCEWFSLFTSDLILCFSGASRKDQPSFTLKQVSYLCERLLKDHEEKIREEYEQILNTKLAGNKHSSLNINKNYKTTEKNRLLIPAFTIHLHSIFTFWQWSTVKVSLCNEKHPDPPPLWVSFHILTDNVCSAGTHGSLRVYIGL